MKTNHFLGLAAIASMIAISCSKDGEWTTPQPPVSASGARAAAVVEVRSTIIVGAGKTFDGAGNTYKAVGLGDGSQDEGQKPIFRLEKGAKLRNLRIAFPGVDGVHCYGDNTVENVVWEDVGEDALTVKGQGSVTVSGGSATAASDKIFQLNQPCTFTLRNFTASNFGKVIRQLGGSTFKTTVYIDNCRFSNGKECIARSDASTSLLYYRGMTVSGVPKLWIYPSASQIRTY